MRRVLPHSVCSLSTRHEPPKAATHAAVRVTINPSSHCSASDFFMVTEHNGARSAFGDAARCLRRARIHAARGQAIARACSSTGEHERAETASFLGFTVRAVQRAPHLG